MKRAEKFNMQIVGPPEIMVWIKKLEGLRDKLMQDKDEITEVYNNILGGCDARITIYMKLIIACNSLQLSLLFIHNNLMQPKWWLETSIKILPDSDKKLYMESFQTFVKIAFIQVLFSSIESSFRLYLRKLAPDACKKGTAGFESIYVCLFRSHLSTISNEGIDLLNLFRNIRNTIHNNGVYYHEEGEGSMVIWRGKKYNFEHGKPINFVTWDLIFSVVDAIGSLVMDVLKAPELKAVSDDIIDPMYREMEK